MPRIRFYDYQYFPELTSSWPEKTAFCNLSLQVKTGILPIFLLGQVENGSASLDPAVQNINECVQDRPFIIDLVRHLAPTPYVPAAGIQDEKAKERFDRETSIKNQYDKIINDLINPDDGFIAWRQFVSQWPKAIPVIQFTHPQSQARRILRQAAMLSANNQSIAIRLSQTNANDLYPIISNIFAVVEHPWRILFIFDMGQARSLMADREAFVADAIDQISSLVDERHQSRLRFLCMGGSFPKAVKSGINEYNIHEREIWANLRESSDIRYGDYGSMQRVIPTSTFRPSDFRAAVTLPRNTSWLCWKSLNANDATGWQAGAADLSNNEAFDDCPDCWGKELLSNAAEGTTADVERNRYWIAARVNMHITSQLKYSNDILNYSEES